MNTVVIIEGGFGCVFVVWALCAAVTWFRLSRRGVHTVGQVVGEVADAEGSRFKKVGFEDSQGRYQTFTAGKMGPPVGSPIPVVYMPHRPHKARADTTGHRVRAIVIPALFAAFFLFLSIFRLTHP